MYSDNNSEILNRMLGNVPSDVSKSEGTFIYDSLSPISKELSQAYINLDEVLKMVFAKTAADNGYSEQLDLRASEFGVTRKAGTFASGQVIFKGADNTAIKKGTVVQTKSGLQYTTTEDGIIANGTASINVQAIKLGNFYNVPSDTIIQLPVQITGVTGVNNPQSISGGSDLETDVSLLKRLLLKVQSPATSGNATHYVQWALDVDGIGAAKVFPLWNNVAGTVKVCAVDSNMQPLTDVLLTSMKKYIEEQRPIGANVTYESAASLPINITVTVKIDAAYTKDKVQTSIVEAITKYLKSIAFNQDYVSYAVIGSLILSTDGVNDYSSLQINNSNANVTVGSEQVATMGGITLSVTQ